MSYNIDINWGLLRDQVDLISDDKPVLLKKFIPNPEKLASWEDVERVLNGYIYNPFDIIDNGVKIEVPTYDVNFGLPLQNKEFIQQNIQNGKTFIIYNYSLKNEYGKLICKELEKLLPINVDMHVYGSKGHNSESFRPHIDTPSNFIIQTYGECDWTIYSNYCSSLVSCDADNLDIDMSKLTPVIETTLTPGDMLYIPSRLYHKASPSKPRISVSIPCNPGIEGRLDKNYYQL